MSPGKRLPGTAVAVLLFCTFFISAGAEAQSTLSGTVFGGGSPLSNTLVEALTDGTTTVAGAFTTGPSGQYSIALSDGTYDLRVTPPVGSGFGQETIQNVALAGDRTYDVILLAAGAGRVLGVIRGYGGAPIAGASVYVYSSSGQFLASTSSDGNGHYEAVVNGTVSVQFSGSDSSAVPIAPRNWNAYRYNLLVAGNTTLDLTLPVARISGTVRDPNGAAVFNASVEVNTYSNLDALQMSLGSSAYATTNASGAYEYLTLNGSNNVTVRPSNGSGLTPLSETATVNGDSTKDFVLANAIILTGTVRGYAGAPVSGASIYTYTSAGQFIGSTSTDANGQYSVAVAAGSTSVQFSGSDSSAVPIAPRNWNAYRYNLLVAGNTTLDLTLPVARISGTVRDPNGAAVFNASVEVNTYSNLDALQMSLGSSAYATTNASGAYEYLTLNGSNNVTVRPSNGSGLTPLSETATVNGDSTKDFVLANAIILTGTVRGYAGAPVSGASIYTYTSAGQFIGSTSTDASGQYSVAVAAGSTSVQFSGSDSSAVPIAPRNWNAYRYNLPVAGNTTLDLSLPAVRLDGTTTDSNGAPVPNVSLEVNGYANDDAAQLSRSYSAYATSGPAGTYEMILLKGQANFTIRPPSSSGFLTSVLSPTITGDLTQRMVLQRPDLSPPQITAGPVVVHLSDTSASISWTTNEPATSVVDYGVGALMATASTPGFVTNHIVTLQGLTPLTTYQFRAASTDAAGNGPTYGTGSFTTLDDPGDITPPHITDGPTVVFVDQTTAIVQWETDEPASSTIAYGTGGTLDSTVSGPAGVFTLFHSVTLTGLTASTTYSAQVTSADPDGNSVSSSVFPITTLATPDTFPPIILTGPFIVSTTDTQIVVEWTTNEPATSGVSFNDGTVFDTVTDNTLTTAHQVTLSGLTPATTYQITVSSTDAVGNGPTLGGPVPATTDAEADDAPPVISNVQVTQITETSALVTFTTDEPATIVLNYGVDPGALNQTQADLSPSTSHAIVLNGLNDGTQYFFTLQATDSSSNSSTAGPFDFTTESSFIDQPPTQPGPITGPLSPNKAETFTLTWGASTDDILLTGYQLLLDGQVLASLDAFTTSYEVSGVTEGQHTFVVRATDSAAHATDSAPFALMIDRTAPVIDVPDDIEVGTAGSAAVVDYAVSASDNLDGQVVGSCLPPSGFAFPVGATTVTCSAQDAAGNTGEASFSITVVDEGDPTLVLPVNQILEATANGGAVASFQAAASDVVDGVITPDCTAASPSFFAVGTHTVSCTATDAAGNSVTGSFTITVRDTSAPVIGSVRPSQATLWPPNHQLVSLTIITAVSDLGDTAPVCRISSVTSNEPIDGLGDGDTSPDWMNVSGLSLSLRAERSGKGNGRVYSIGVTCQDASGNVSTGTTAVMVPKNQSGK